MVVEVCSEEVLVSREKRGLDLAETIAEGENGRQQLGKDKEVRSVRPRRA